MIAVLLYGLTLLAAALLSARADRSAFSTSVLFLAVGLLAGSLGWMEVSPQSPVVTQFADLALFVVLFSDGMRCPAGTLRHNWKLPARALLVGMPLTFLAIAGLAHFAAGLPWILALLLAAMLSPTDPVFAAALVQRDEVDAALRNLLNVESGLNDGLALPMVLGLLAFAGVADHPAWVLLLEVVGGAIVGVGVPWACDWLRRRDISELHGVFSGLFVAAIGVLVYAVASLSGANEYIAGFSAGITVATLSPALAEEFRPMGERLSEALKFATLLVFGAMVSPASFLDIGLMGWAFVLGALVVARPLGLLAALAGTRLGWRERLVAAWFGPKGFASVVYAFVVLRSALPQGPHLFELAAVVVAISIAVHSSTDVPAARWLARHRRGQSPE